MNRDPFIRECYKVFTGSDNTPETKRGYFNRLISYVRWLDQEGLREVNGDFFHKSLIDQYMTWCSEQYDLGKLSIKSRRDRKSLISWYLKSTGRLSQAKALPVIKKDWSESQGTSSLEVEAELKPVIKALFKAYKELIIHYKNNTKPEVHPLYCETLLEREASKRELKGNKLAGHRKAFRNTLNKTHVNNHIVGIAIMLCYAFTGINSQPLKKLKISDIRFKDIQGGKFILDTVKGRAGFQEQDNTIGFSKHAKEFFESWLSVSLSMSRGDSNAYAFPYTNSEGYSLSYVDAGIQPQKNINKLLSRLGLTPITPSKLRKTKLDTLFRVTESVYLVSLSANNSMTVIAQTYVNGTDKEHERKLSSSMDAAFAIANGKNIPDAINQAKQKFSEVLDDYEYQRLREGQDRSHESRTPTGTRCLNNTMGSAKIIDRALKRLDIEAGKGEAICTTFIDCFECEHHAFVADITDIWLMLSFKQTLQELQQVPAINSMPESKYIKLCKSVNTVLKGYKEKSHLKYQQACNMLKDSPHPLYSNVYSLNDLLEAFS